MGAGFPQRPLRSAFATVHAERLPEDPRSELGAAELALLLHQAAAMGRGAPEAVVLYQPANVGLGLSERVKLGLLAWDDVTYVDVAPAFGWLTTTVNAVGNYTLSFTTPAPDETGVMRAVSFAAGMAVPVGITGAPIVSNPACEVLFVDTHSPRVMIYQRPGGALAYQAFLLVLW